MTTRVRNPFAVKAATLALLALVLSFRILIPAGYMIAPSGGWPSLTLCEAAAPAPAHHGGHHSPAGPAQPCAYAALAAPALPPAPPPLAAPLSPPEPGPPEVGVRTSVPPEPAALPPPSTGPPIRV